jgi:hypothetical protein
LCGGRISEQEQRQQFEEDAQRYGIPIELLLDSTEITPDEFEIWPENDVSLGVFLRCSTQWRYRTEGECSRLTGLDYPAVETVMRLCEVEKTGEVFNDIRAMELAILAKVNETNT